MNSVVKFSWGYIKAHPIRFITFILFRVGSVAAILYSAIYIGLVQGKETSSNLSKDFIALEAAQAPLVEKMISLNDALLGQSDVEDFSDEMRQLSESAQATLVKLGRVRAPNNGIVDARYEYRKSLEALVGLATRAKHNPQAVSALQYHNALQNVSNGAGAFQKSIEDFQGGALPQILGSVF